MGRLTNAEREFADTFVPRVRDPGGFSVRFCAHCGAKLTAGAALWFEGPLCLSCDILARAGLFRTGDVAEDVKGGAR